MIWVVHAVCLGLFGLAGVAGAYRLGLEFAYFDVSYTLVSHAHVPD